MSGRRRLIILAGKIVVAAVLIGWLVHSGTLDFGALRVFLDRPALLIMDLGVFSLGTVLGALRWRLLLRAAEIDVPVGRAIQLQLVAMFFNVVVPGNIGGDVIKSVYVARTVAPAKRPAVYLIALVDRLIAVAGLVVVAFVLTVVRGSAAWEATPMRRLTGAIAVLAVVTLVVPLVVLVIMRRSGTRAAGAPAGGRGGRIVGQLLAAARLLSARPGTLVAALGLSIAVHAGGMVLFGALARAITPQDVPLSIIATVYPLGLLTMVIPISYAGIGVGHVAFDHLFAMLGLTGGATVFNVYLIGQATPCLLGVLPYLTFRREAAPPTEAEVEAQRTGSSAGADRL